MDEVARRRIQKKRAQSLTRRFGMGRERCEVIVCGDGGPHRCEHTVTVRRPLTIDGHRVCSHHYWEQRHLAVFTAEEAIALHRQRIESDRLWLRETA